MSFTGSQPIRGHFSKDETDRIRESVAKDDGIPPCPRCGEKLTSSLPPGGRCSRHDVWEFHCERCFQSAVIEDDL